MFWHYAVGKKDKNHAYLISRYLNTRFHYTMYGRLYRDCLQEYPVLLKNETKSVYD